MHPRDEKKLTIDRYPRCKGYLAAMWIKPPYHGMNDYWCAVAIAESFDDEYLADLGTVNFDTMSGSQLLGVLESILAGRAKTAKSRPVVHAKKASTRRRKNRKSPAPKAA